MDDWPAAYELWRTAGEGVQLRPSDRREEVAKKLGHDPELFLVAEREGQVVGVIIGGWDGRRGWLHHLAVAHSARRLGIGRALVTAVEKRLRAKGCLKVNLLVRRDNQQALDLYRSMGYQDMEPMIALGKEL
jgi:ribosomal protein S18 acetylase RimI-like enzyme